MFLMTSRNHKSVFLCDWSINNNDTLMNKLTLYLPTYIIFLPIFYKLIFSINIIFYQLLWFIMTIILLSTWIILLEGWSQVQWCNSATDRASEDMSQRKTLGHVKGTNRHLELYCLPQITNFSFKFSLYIYRPRSTR